MSYGMSSEISTSVAEWQRPSTASWCGRIAWAMYGMAVCERQHRFVEHSHYDRTRCEKTSCLLSLGRQNTNPLPSGYAAVHSISSSRNDLSVFSEKKHHGYSRDRRTLWARMAAASGPTRLSILVRKACVWNAR